MPPLRGYSPWNSVTALALWKTTILVSGQEKRVISLSIWIQHTSVIDGLTLASAVVLCLCIALRGRNWVLVCWWWWFDWNLGRPRVRLSPSPPPPTLAAEWFDILVPATQIVLETGHWDKCCHLSLLHWRPVAILGHTEHTSFTPCQVSSTTNFVNTPCGAGSRINMIFFGCQDANCGLENEKEKQTGWVKKIH